MNFELNKVFENEFIISEKVYENFINLSNDRNLLHTNAIYAKSKGFDDKVMHGNILNAFISFFVGECLPTNEIVIHFQTIKFKNPCYLNEILKFKATVISIIKSVNVVEFDYQFSNLESKIIAQGKIQIGII